VRARLQKTSRVRDFPFRHGEPIKGQVTGGSKILMLKLEARSNLGEHESQTEAPCHGDLSANGRGIVDKRGRGPVSNDDFSTASGMRKSSAEKAVGGGGGQNAISQNYRRPYQVNALVKASWKKGIEEEGERRARCLRKCVEFRVFLGGLEESRIIRFSLNGSRFGENGRVEKDR